MAALSFFSCEKGVMVSQKWKWKDKAWVQGDKKTIQLEATDTSKIYQMDIQVSHEETYAFQNLYVRTTTVFPSGKNVTSVTSLELLDEQGYWAGDYGENCCKVRIPLQRKFTFPELGMYSWTIEPYMRVDTVKGIEALQVICKEWKE